MCIDVSSHIQNIPGDRLWPVKQFRPRIWVITRPIIEEQEEHN